MSLTDGTARPGSGNAPNVVDRQRVQGPGDYVQGMEETAPMDVVDQAVLDREDGRAAVRRLENRAGVANDLLRLQHNNAGALLDHLDEDEIDDERAVRVLARTRAREFEAWKTDREFKGRKRRIRMGGLVDGWRAFLDDRAAQRDKRETASDSRWHLRAQRVRKRLTSVDAQIATQIRSATRWSNLLITLMLGGMLYTGFVVQNNFVPSGDKTDPKFWLSLGLEAMCSVALMALMRADARASVAGMVRSTRETVQGWAIKAMLLLASLAAAAGPAIKAGNLMDIVRTGFAPVLVAGVLLIHARISRNDSHILHSLTQAAEKERLAEIVIKAEFAVEQGLLTPSQDNKAGEIAPSASKIASFFKIGKEDAGEVRATINAKAGVMA